MEISNLSSWFIELPRIPGAIRLSHADSGPQGAHAGAAATKPTRDVDEVGPWMIRPCPSYLALFHSPSLPSSCAPCGIVVAKIFIVPLPFPVRASPTG